MMFSDGEWYLVIVLNVEWRLVMVKYIDLAKPNSGAPD